MEILIIIGILFLCFAMAESSKKWVRGIGNGVGIAILVCMGLAVAAVVVLFALFGIAGIGALLERF